MKLLSHHVELLSPLEKKVYRSLIGDRAHQSNKRQLFISQSQRYYEGDEELLPFPERSRRGIMLRTLSEQLAKDNVTAAFLKARVSRFNGHIKSKLQALGTHRVYVVPPKQITAAIHGNGKSPFWFYRDKVELKLKGLERVYLPEAHLESEEEQGAPDSDIICAIDPPPRIVNNTSEYEVLAVLLKASESLGGLDQLPLFAEAAHLGLHQVDDLGDGRLWLSKEVP